MRHRRPRHTIRFALCITLPMLVLAPGCPQRAKPVSDLDKLEAIEAAKTQSIAEQSGIAAVVTDPAEQHNLRMASFGALFLNAVKRYEQAHGHMPLDLADFIHSGFLWLLPTAPPPARYTYIENLGDESSPFWEQLNFVFLPEYIDFGFFNVTKNQSLDNPAGEAPQRHLQITPGLNPKQLERESVDPIPIEWELELTKASTPPERRLELLRRRSQDPVEVLAIHLFDTLDLLLDRFANTQGRMPANFNDLLAGNWVTTAQFQALEQPLTPEAEPGGRLTLQLAPAQKVFIWEVQLFTRSGLIIGDRQALQMDAESAGPRRSDLLLIVDPNQVDMTDARDLLVLYVPTALTDLPSAAQSVTDQATVAENDAAPAETGAAQH